MPELDTPQSALANDPIFDGLEMQPGIDVDWGDPDATPMQRLLNRNQFEIIALELGNAEKPAYAVQPRAIARFGLSDARTAWKACGQSLWALLADVLLGDGIDHIQYFSRHLMDR